MGATTAGHPELPLSPREPDLAGQNDLHDGHRRHDDSLREGMLPIVVKTWTFLPVYILLLASLDVYANDILWDQAGDRPNQGWVDSTGRWPSHGQAKRNQDHASFPVPFSSLDTPCLCQWPVWMCLCAWGGMVTCHIEFLCVSVYVFANVHVCVHAAGCVCV